MLMGQGEKNKDLLKPIDLFYEENPEPEKDAQTRKQTLRDTMKILKMKSEVKVPIPPPSSPTLLAAALSGSRTLLCRKSRAIG